MMVKEMEIPADLGEVEKVGFWIKELLNQFRPAPDSRTVARIDLAVHELVVNCVVHGTDDEDTLKLRVWQDDRHMKLEVRDQGQTVFDAARVPCREEGRAEIGGFGLKIIRNASTEFYYERNGEHNVWRVTFDVRPDGER